MPQEGVCQWKSILDEIKALQKPSEDTQLCMHHKSKRMYKKKGTAVSMKTRATIEDLYKVEGKAELVNGEIVCMSPTGGRPGRASLEIAMSLRLYEREHGGGYAFPNNVAFAVNLPHRESFGPDASWYVGSVPDMRFPQGAPLFAAEMRSQY